ncbi:SDR family NAD(P)-dependent oxidoreductase [Nannocystis sp. ILAH1]|uniref:SDR family oxidoreductase n=1 Tax=Nannocystis sp. ILAH1 TaxID=2996789 RepID=UPI00226F1510|nr:SDR family NAD(P)-dependent oxidoreductase [Nannocystis sp. ILAH1]MCY0988731.1 SDR family NAD(P)-dependent oxidoreductase [Nannocystis sp. ILAH1]
MQDKVIVITGASMGIGEALANVCHARGATIVLAARNAEALAAVVGRLGERALAVPTDVSRREDNEKLVERTLAQFGRLDVFVANAGRGISRMPSQLTDDDVDDMIATNFKSVLYAVQAVLPLFKERQRGQIVAVSSMLGRIPFTPIRSAYSAAKAAVNSLMTSVRLELRPQFPEIHATTVLPGVVATGFGDNARHGGLDSRQLPGAQPVEEVAEIIAAAIEQPRAEVFTRPEMHAFQAKFYAAEDVATIEAGLGGPPQSR